MKGSSDYFTDGRQPDSSKFHTLTKAVATRVSGDFVLGPDKRLQNLEKGGSSASAEHADVIQLLKDAKRRLA